jgi:23S rRNA (pseudouridine1915-N3)-methyltransferase
MKLRFVWVGKTRNASVKELIREYLERVDRFGRAEIVELRDRTDVGSESRVIIDKEGKEILSRTAADSFVVALDERGQQLDSQALARFIDNHRVAGTKQITFVIGGHLGLSDEVRKRADLVLGLSRMTFTHEMARALLLEQVYRAFTIIHDLPYQK